MKTLSQHQDYDLGRLLYWAVHRPAIGETNDAFFLGIFTVKRNARRSQEKLNIKAYVHGWLQARAQAINNR